MKSDKQQLVEIGAVLSLFFDRIPFIEYEMSH